MKTQDEHLKILRKHIMKTICDHISIYNSISGKYEMLMLSNVNPSKRSHDFLNNLDNPPEPNERLKQSVKHHERLTKRRRVDSEIEPANDAVTP